MKIETTFSCGDKAWAFCENGVQLLTIGQVRVEVTDSPGVEQGGIEFDNYKPASSYREQYMCVETGIGSGSIYTVGEHIFATEAECIAANAEHIARIADEKEQDRKRKREYLLQQESSLRLRLAEIDALKATQP